MSKCGGVLVPPLGRGPDSPRETWIRVCYVDLHPELEFSAKQLALTVDHWFPQSKHAVWGLNSEERSRTHQAHMRCQSHQGGRTSNGGKVFADSLYWQIPEIAATLSQRGRLGGEATAAGWGKTPAGIEALTAAAALGGRRLAESGWHNSPEGVESHILSGSKTPPKARNLGRHNRWHRDRGITNPHCYLCRQEIDFQ